MIGNRTAICAHAALCAAAIVGSAGAATVYPIFAPQNMYGYPIVFGLSGNGAVVVGRVPAGAFYIHGFQWTLEYGLEDLGSPTGVNGSEFRAVSVEGTVLVGKAFDPAAWDTYQYRPIRWTRAGGFEFLQTFPDAAFGQAAAVSAYGAVIVGDVWASIESNHRAVVWTSTGLVQEIGPADGSYSTAIGVNQSGSVVVGNHGSHAFRWTAATGMLDIGPTGFRDYSIAVAVSADGNVVVGKAAIEGGVERAFRWSAASGFEFIPSDDTEITSDAISVSGDGETITGTMVHPGGAGTQLVQTYIWTRSTGKVDLAPAVYGHSTSANVSPAFISADARAVAVHRSFDSPALVRLQESCRADFNGDGIVDFFDYLDFVDAFSIGCP